MKKIRVHVAAWNLTLQHNTVLTGVALAALDQATGKAKLDRPVVLLQRSRNEIEAQPPSRLLLTDQRSRRVIEQGHALMSAFFEIKDRSVRQSIVDFVVDIAAFDDIEKR